MIKEQVTLSKASYDALIARLQNLEERVQALEPNTLEEVK